MKPEDLKKLFSAFGKLEDKSSINKGGLGLGLNICKNITQLLGGSIEVSSEFEKGTEFTFSIKLDFGESHISFEQEQEIKCENYEILTTTNGISDVIGIYLKEKNLFSNLTDDSVFLLQQRKINE